MIDELAIRTAIEAIADEARPGTRIKADLHRRIRRYRQRRLILRVAGVGAVTGIAGVWASELLRDDRRFPHIIGGPGGGWLAAPVRFRPGWLPTGYGAATLGAVVAGDTATVVERTWADPTSATNDVSLTVGWSDVYPGNQAPSHTTSVNVNGVAGTLTEYPNGSTNVQWQPPGEPKLTVSVSSNHGPDDRRTVALRIARSLVPDTATLDVGPRLGWLPPDLATTPWMFSVTYDDTSWTQLIAIRLHDGSELDIDIGPTVVTPDLPPDAKRVTVHGVEARYATPDPDRLTYTTPDGVKVWLQLDRRHAPTGPDDLVRIADQLDLGPRPDMSWVGSR